MKFSVSDMLMHYSKEANYHGPSGTSTIQDMRTRELELHAIGKYIQDREKVLEVGCGNGYTSWVLARNKRINIDAYDLCPEFIEIAKNRQCNNLKGKIKYFEADATTWSNENNYDTIFTERTLQNIPFWESQCRAFKNIYRSLKLGGIYIMEECFLSGLNNLNAARAELNLPAIEQPWHNSFFDDKKVFFYMDKLGFEKICEDAFLSGYYFGSRVLLSALYPKDKPLKSHSILNDYFCALPPAGNFCPMRIVVFKKLR